MSAYVTIRILFDPKTNSVTVDGPFDDSVVFLGMLEMAKVCLLEYRQRKANQSIVEAPPNLRV